jgi:hypothetical protein
MGFIGYFGHLGIVRVLSVPVMMGALIYILYVLAAPPSDNNRDDGVESS